jgi:MFS family permease
MGGSVSVTDSATLSGSLVAGTGNLEIYAPVRKGMTVGAGNVRIGNQVGGNITAGAEQIEFTSDAHVKGDVAYWSENKADIAHGASLSGQIVQHTPPKGSTEHAKNAAKGFFSAVSVAFTLASFLSALVIGLLLIRFAPRFFEKTARTIQDKPGASVLIGIIALIIIPIIGIVLFATLLLIPLSILIMLMFGIALYVSKLFIAYAIGRKACEILNVTWGPWLIFLAGLIIYYAITLIPVIGWLLSFIGLLLGFGALLSSKKDYYRVLSDKKIL